MKFLFSLMALVFLFACGTSIQEVADNGCSCYQNDDIVKIQEILGPIEYYVDDAFPLDQQKFFQEEIEKCRVKWEESSAEVFVETQLEDSLTFSIEDLKINHEGTVVEQISEIMCACVDVFEASPENGMKCLSEVDKIKSGYKMTDEDAKTLKELSGDCLVEILSLVNKHNKDKEVSSELGDI